MEKLNEEYGYIYETINKVNGKRYIGQSVGKFKRDYHGSGIAIKNAINKYGRAKFSTKQIDSASTREKLNNTEIKHISEYRDGFGGDMLYNISTGGASGYNGCLGRHHSAETKEKMRKNHIGMEGKEHSDEIKKKIGGSSRGVKRKPFTERHINNMIKNHVGMKGKTGKVPWNKGLTKETDERLGWNGKNTKLTEVEE